MWPSESTVNCGCTGKKETKTQCILKFSDNEFSQQRRNNMDETKFFFFLWVVFSTFTLHKLTVQ